MELKHIETTLLLNVYIHARDLSVDEKKQIEKELKLRGALV